MMFKSIYSILFAVFAAMQLSAMHNPQQDMIRIEEILGIVEEIAAQHRDQEQSHFRFMQNEIFETIAPMLTPEGTINRRRAAEIVTDVFNRNGFGMSFDVINALINHHESYASRRAPLQETQKREIPFSFRFTFTANHFSELTRLADASNARRQSQQHLTSHFDAERIRPDSIPLPSNAQTIQPKIAESMHKHKTISEDDTCSICMEKLQGANNIVCISPCDDHFHLNCITGWQESGRSQASNCPNCRGPIRSLKPTPAK